MYVLDLLALRDTYFKLGAPDVHYYYHYYSAVQQSTRYSKHVAARSKACEKLRRQWKAGHTALTAGAACWLERRTRGQKVASSNPGQERRENFLLQSQRCVLTLIRCPSHPRVTAVARKRPWSFCQKFRWQVTPKHAYTFDPPKSKYADNAAVQA